MTVPIGVSISNLKFSRGDGDDIGFPSNQGPFGSLSGFLKCDTCELLGCCRFDNHPVHFEYTNIVLWSMENCLESLLELSLDLQITDCMKLLRPNISSHMTLQ